MAGLHRGTLTDLAAVGKLLLPPQEPANGQGLAQSSPFLPNGTNGEVDRSQSETEGLQRQRRALSVSRTSPSHRLPLDTVTNPFHIVMQT
jgi:hypothetical protein